MIGGAVRTLLVGNLNIQKDVGDNIFPMIIPQGVGLPGIVYQEIDTDPQLEKLKRPGVDVVTLQLTCYHESYDDAVRIMRSVRAILENYTGTTEDVIIKKVWMVSQGDAFDIQGEKMGRRQDYKIRVANQFIADVAENDDRENLV